MSQEAETEKTKLFQLFSHACTSSSSSTMYTDGILCFSRWLTVRGHLEYQGQENLQTEKTVISSGHSFH